MIIGSTLILLIIVACNSVQRSKNAKWENAINSLVVSDLERVPDSMKSWVFDFRRIILSDQRYRKSPDIYHKNLDAQNSIDRVNERKILAYLKKYGFPDIKTHGKLAHIVVSRVVNHGSDSFMFLYYPYFIEGYKTGKIKSDFSTFEDRLNVQMNRRQYYGSQLNVTSKGQYFLAPVYNIDSLDYFRKEIGLDPISEYFKESFKIEWDIKEYKRTEDSLIKKLKINDSIPIRFILLP